MPHAATAQTVGSQQILIVDDHDDVRDALVALLEAEGYPTITAANGSDALSVLQGLAVRPCLILLDLMMPVMDGSEFREKQLDDPQLAGIPVIIVSAYGQRTQGRALGAVGYVPKPIDVERLLDAVRAQCGPPPAQG